MKCMKRKLWIRIGAVLLAGLLLWWLFWAILIDEDENEQSLPETEQIDDLPYDKRMIFRHGYERTYWNSR